MGIKRKAEEYEIVSSDKLDETNDKIRKFKEVKSKEQKAAKRKKEQSAEPEEKSLEKKTKKDADFTGKPPTKKKGAFKSKAFEKSAEKNEKVDWKKVKQERKDLKVKRKKNENEAGNEGYELSVEAKKIWEEVRREDCKEARKAELCEKLHKLIKGQVRRLIFAHDTVRVIETLVSQGSEKYRTALYEELKDEMPFLVKNKYSRFFVLKLLRYGTKFQKDAIMESFKGQVVELMKHKVACDAVELAYNDYANAKQRSSMIQEFFGPHFRLFKDEEIHTLDDALKKHPEKKEYILKDINQNLQPIIDKGVFTNTIIHTLLKQYLSVCSQDDRAGFIESLKEHLLPIIHTRDGARVAMLCIWNGTNKDRKVILKSFKGHFQKIATEEFGFMVLLAALDCVDDTVFLKKAVLTELLSDVKYLAATDPGKKVLKYIVAPRSKQFFHPDIIKVLQQGDDNQTSKKDPEQRRKEIYAAVSESILKEINENILEWAFDSHWTLFVGAALQNLEGPIKSDIFGKLSNLCSEPYVPGETDHILEVSHTNKLISYLIVCDKERAKNESVTFSKYLIKDAKSEFPGWTITNRGCFLLVKLIETEIKEVSDLVIEVITPLKKRLEKQDTPGAKILLKKLV